VDEPFTRIPDYPRIPRDRSGTVAHEWATRLGCPWATMVSDARSV